MKFSYEWLAQLSGHKGSAKDLAELLSVRAFETEVVKNSEFPGIIVAKVTKIEKHPNADRLRVIELTDGKQNISPVVCGAWNFDVGAFVPLALPGAVIPVNTHDASGQSFVLNKATIRGVESQGMICSAKELGLAGDSEGILLLDKNLELGSDFSPKNSKEIIFDISVPANRPDILSYRGVAWEISALTNSKYQAKPVAKTVTKLRSNILKVRVSEPKLCSLYSALRISNISVGPSPQFIQNRLKESGLRPINNVVDITNYVMLEMGQPMHAFDAMKVNGGINVRKAYVNETITTLDGQDRKLSSDILVIADSKQALAIAGIIGGQNSAVTDATTEIILEAANFNSVQTRLTSKKLGLRTDASSRFERSLPSAFVDQALQLASDLLAKYASGKTLEYATTGIKTSKPTIVSVEPDKVNALLGLNLSKSSQKKILTNMGFTVSGANTLRVTVPFWRPDVKIWQDLAEEIVRFEGLDKIPNISPNFTSSASLSDPRVSIREKISDLLASLGFDEAYTYSFVSRAFLQKYNIDPKSAVEVANPISSDQEFLRLGLGMNYEKLIAQNAKYESKGNLFEIGNAYFKSGDYIKEEMRLYILSFSKDAVPLDYFVGSLKELFHRLGIDFSVKQIDEQTGNILSNGQNLGPIQAETQGEVKWIAAELRFDELAKFIQASEFQTINRYPSRQLDVAILVREDLSWQQVKDVATPKNFKLLQDVELIEVYRGKNVTPGKKSLTFRLTYQAPDRTLTDEEVEKIHSQILGELKAKLNVQIRD
ncbi:MAG TPA: phenylalanine--tRNA ligase subunit beta [Methylomirabilota bacterium]|nr:phenylalanine--tRNA ligase subunit beta [Methylomirabilota bacterium]